MPDTCLYATLGSSRAESDWWGRGLCEREAGLVGDLLRRVVGLVVELLRERPTGFSHQVVGREQHLEYVLYESRVLIETGARGASDNLIVVVVAVEVNVT